MTQNPYQPPPPGYGQPPQGPPPGQYQPVPQGPPPGYGQPPQGPPVYAQPQYQQPAPQAAPAAGGPDGFGTPDNRPSAGDQPAIHQLSAERRLVLIRPDRWNVGGKKFNSEEPEEQMIVDIIVCDGPPISGSQDFTTKVITPFAAGPKSVPIFITGAIINKAVLDRCRSALTDPTTPNTVLGRLVTNPPTKGKGFPWNNLEDPTEQDKQVARPIFAAWETIRASAIVASQAAPAQGPPAYAAAATYQPAPAQGPPPGQYPGYGQPPQGPPPGQYPGYQPGPPMGWEPTH